MGTWPEGVGAGWGKVRAEGYSEDKQNGLWVVGRQLEQLVTHGEREMNNMLISQ